MRQFLSLLLFLSCICLPVFGDIVFSNVTSTTGSGLAGGTFAAEFSPAENYQLTSASAFLSYTGGAGPNPFNFFIYSNNGGVPGSQLTSLSTTIPRSLNEQLLITATSPTPGLTLTAGTDYWLVIPTGNLTGLSWLTSGSSSVASSTENFITHTWFAPTSRSFQFEIDGTLIAPEPGGPGCAAIGFAILAGVRFARGSNARRERDRGGDSLRERLEPGRRADR